MEPMVTWADATVAVAIAVIAVFSLVAALALVFAKGQLESAERTRRYQTLLDLSTRWESQLLRDARQLVAAAGQENLASETQRYRAERLKEFWKLASLMNFFEDMGIIVAEEEDMLPAIRKRFASTAVNYYDRFQDFIVDTRKQEPNALEHWEALVGKLRG